MGCFPSREQALLQAAREGDAVAVKACVERGADIETKTKEARHLGAAPPHSRGASSRQREGSCKTNWADALALRTAGRP